MAFPPQPRGDAAPTLPSIRVPGSADRNRSHHDDMPFGRSLALSIPGVDSQLEAPPPPLPPPRMPFGGTMPSNHDLPHQRHGFHSSHSSFASGYGSAMSSIQEDRRRDPRSIIKDERDEGYSSWSSLERSHDSFARAPFGLHHNSFQFQSPADLHGASLKKKLETSRGPEISKPISLLTTSANELLPKPPSESRFSPSLSIPSQLPLHTRSFDSPRSTDSGGLSAISAISPRSAPFQQHGGMDYRSTHEAFDYDRSPRTRTRNNSDDASSTQTSYDYGYADEMEMEETQDLKRLQLSDGYASVRQKRRAGSPPPSDAPMGFQGKADLVIRRNELASRGSPTPRLSSNLGSSLHSLSRSNSYMSINSVAPPTSAVHERRSPGGSPGGISPTSATSPYTTPLSLQPSPHTAFGTRAPMHARNGSATSPKKLPDLQKPGGPKGHGFHMCECCPKKPKKFESREELRAHEAEKQYTCQYCGNRFKNKNEAERHMNSLHVRRHSWSCSALSSYDRAFHESTNLPGQADTCGYCGEDFHRSGTPTAPKRARVATDEDWDERVRHLQEVHKFGECNSSKKFFRADHFRQHLKHSHAGTSGKWTNMLETACMIEEEQPRHRDEVSL